VTTAARHGRQEVDGVHYRFVDDETFDELVATDQLLEWAWCTPPARYGTPRARGRAGAGRGRSALLEIDLQGARQVRSTMPEALSCSCAPVVDELVRRLVGRRQPRRTSSASAAVLSARHEMAAEAEFDATIVNSDVTPLVKSW
jgi:guanylate kinase